MKERKYPVYDRLVDGNHFNWIVVQAQELREERQTARIEPSKPAYTAPTHGRPKQILVPVHPEKP